MMSLTAKIKEYALDIGYSKVGIIPADSFPEYIADITNRSEMYSFFVKELPEQRNHVPRCLGQNPSLLP